jgi:hypothetical protein
MRAAMADLLPSKVQWRKSKNGFQTPQSRWLQTTMREELAQWVRNPSPLFKEIVDARRLVALKDELFRSSLHPKDERQFLFVRLFLLDRWLKSLKVELPSIWAEPKLAPQALATRALLVALTSTIGQSW